MDLSIIEPQQVVDPPASCDQPRLGQWRPRHFWTWSHRLTALAFLLLLLAIGMWPIAGVRGSPTAVTWLAAAPIIDPLAALEVLLASYNATAWMLLGALVPIAMAVLMGRVFCGWLCPMGLMLEMGGLSHRWVRRTLSRFGWHLPSKQVSNHWKYWILAGCLIASFVAGLPVFSSVSPINLTIVGALRWPWLVVGFVVLLSSLEVVWPRVFCRALCPLGALYCLLGSKAPFRIRVVGEERLRCRQCVMHCPMGIDVMNDHVLAGHQSVDDPECTRCGVCTDVCHGDILRLRWTKDPSIPTSAHRDEGI